MTDAEKRIEEICNVCQFFSVEQLDAMTWPTSDIAFLLSQLGTAKREGMLEAAEIADGFFSCDGAKDASVHGVKEAISQAAEKVGE